MPVPTTFPQGKRKLVHIEWVDASGPTKARWEFVADYDYSGEYRCWSVGWIVAETRTHYHVVPHLGNIDVAETEQMLGRITIPRHAVRRMKTLVSFAAR